MRYALSCFSKLSSSSSTATLSPALTATAFTTPSLSARNMFCIFIASTTAKRWPGTTLSPALTSSATILPGMGERRELEWSTTTGTGMCSESSCWRSVFTDKS
eukprot:TRINITY_DN314_c0_g1_i4.p1 TRINITY_DN314_c0_g1~~TRINITY_DN314_c0_g1_i4.p1  ORF type:complete len:103 (+),score=5.68 TRINITY_DN314_c0_g1_i4:133-441(+)